MTLIAITSAIAVLLGSLQAQETQSMKNIDKSPY
jgi:hypothetical protein